VYLVIKIYKWMHNFFFKLILISTNIKYLIRHANVKQLNKEKILLFFCYTNKNHGKLWPLVQQ
jgi:hypothetical protein